MIEKVHKFGKQEHLVGIASIPEDTRSVSRRPAVLFLNAGLLHHVGPYRLYVDLSRKLAAEGIFSMRFDLSGIGDSQSTHDVLDYSEKVKNDVQSAMAFISKRYKYTDFILIGLCSGAVNAHLVGSVDDRVAGVVLMDGFAYPTLGFYLKNYKPYIINPARFFIKICKVLAKRGKGIFYGGTSEIERNNMFEDLSPPKQIAAQGFQKMVNRGSKILCVYSGGLPNEYNYSNQFVAMFRNVNFGKQLQLEYNENANHTYTSYAERKKLISGICQWVQGTFSQ